MNLCMQQALMFVGAVIGAGFASGREVVSFFSIYGEWSWALILLTVCVMTLLCWLCLRRSGAGTGCRWCAVYPEHRPMVRRLAEGCVLFLQMLMGGSMVSAAGHMAQLAIPVRFAYALGAAVTIALALLLGLTGTKPSAMLTALLAAAFLLAAVALLIFDRGENTASLAQTPDLPRLLHGAWRSVAYAALNLSLAIGVICRCGGCSCRTSGRSTVLFGLWMVGLLFLSNFLYLKHPRVQESAFPMVMLLSRFGRAGFNLSLALMYLAILTTLSAGLYALRTGLENHMSRPAALTLSVLLPLLFSSAGFESLVERWYAPAGILCLGLVFLPMVCTGPKNFRNIS